MCPKEKEKGVTENPGLKMEKKNRRRQPPSGWREDASRASKKDPILIKIM